MQHFFITIYAASGSGEMEVEMKKRFLLSGLFALFLLVLFALSLSWNSIFYRTNVITNKFLFGLYSKEDKSFNGKADDKAEYVIVDRFEGNYAICEDKNSEMINIDRSKIPKEAKEGAVLKIKGDRIEIDYDETGERKDRILELMEPLWK